MLVFRILGFCLGVAIVGATFLSAVRTFVVPRSVPDRLNAVVFRGMRSLFKTIAKVMPTYEQKDGDGCLCPIFFVDVGSHVVVFNGRWLQLRLLGIGYW